MQLSAEAGGMDIERIAQLGLIGAVGAFGCCLQFGVALAQHFGDELGLGIDLFLGGGFDGDARQLAVGNKRIADCGIKALGGEGGAGEEFDVLEREVLADVLLLEVRLGFDAVADAGGLAVLHHLCTGDGAVGGDADHDRDHAGEALALRLEYIARAVAGLVGLGDVFGRDGDLLEVGALRQNGCEGLIGLCCLGSVDHGLGEIVGACQRRGDDKADDGEDNDGFQIFPLHFSAPPTPNGFLWPSLSMCGQRMFISRMAKDTPSG